MRKTKEGSLETRSKLLASALDVFGEKAFSAASLTEISARAGLSKGALYWHFRNKNDLLLCLLEEICRKGDETPAASSTDGLLSGVRQYYMNKYVMLMGNNDGKKIMKIMMRKDEWPEDVQSKAKLLIRDTMEREMTMIKRSISEGQKKGSIRPGVSASVVAVLVSSIFQGLGVLLLEGMLPPEFPQCVDVLFGALEKELTESITQAPAHQPV